VLAIQIPSPSRVENGLQNSFACHRRDRGLAAAPLGCTKTIFFEQMVAVRGRRRERECPKCQQRHATCNTSNTIRFHANLPSDDETFLEIYLQSWNSIAI
jgi:hypothetical protein